MNNLALWLLSILISVAIIAGVITFASSVDKQRALNPRTKCILGYTLIKVGNSWMYQLIDNKQVPCK